MASSVLYLTIILLVLGSIDTSSCVTGEKHMSKCICVQKVLCADGETEKRDFVLDVRMKTDNCDNKNKVCCYNVRETNHSSPGQLDNCGYSGSILSPRITSESEYASFGEFPWTVVLFIRNRQAKRKIFRCAGSLIHQKVVLTAAHCLNNVTAQELMIRAGDWNVRSSQEPLPHQDRSVENIVRHPRFNDRILKNDIALLFLVEKVALSENTATICVPSPGFKATERSQCLVSGWGQRTFEENNLSKVLRKVQLPIVNRQKCVAALKKTRLGEHFTLDKNFICAGGIKDKDSCKGDGGGPLICSVPGEVGRFVQVGIVSWGIGCGQEDIPGIYTNVASLSNWITRQMGKKNLSVSSHS